MKICHVCNFECEENAEICPVCGADLTNPPVESEEINQSVEPVLLATLDDVVSAEIFKDILKDNGILYFCNEDEDGMKVVFGGGFATENIYVEKSQFDEANALYEEFLNSEAEFNGDFEDIFEEEQ